MNLRCLSILIVPILALLSGCSTYKLQGVVVVGNSSSVQVVDADDPRLKGPVVEEPVVEVTLDPDSLRERYIGHAGTTEDGKFSIGVDEPGAGVLLYDVAILCRAPGYSDAHIPKLALPSSGKMLLITMVPGRGKVIPKEDLRGESEKFKRQFE